MRGKAEPDIILGIYWKVKKYYYAILFLHYYILQCQLNSSMNLGRGRYDHWTTVSICIQYQVDLFFPSQSKHQNKCSLHYNTKEPVMCSSSLSTVCHWELCQGFTQYYRNSLMGFIIFSILISIILHLMWQQNNRLGLRMGSILDRQELGERRSCRMCQKTWWLTIPGL